jgi:flagellar hook-associated protein FlgK
MSAELLKLLKRSVGSKLTADLAAELYVAAGRNEHDDLVEERDELVNALRNIMNDNTRCQMDGDVANAILAKYPQP